MIQEYLFFSCEPGHCRRKEIRLKQLEEQHFPAE